MPFPRAACCTLFCLAAVATGLCPSNGNNHGLLITFNGATGFQDVLVLDTFGSLVGSLINRTTLEAHDKKYKGTPHEIGKFKKLRCLTRSPYDGRLMLCSGAPRHSKLLMLSPGPAHEDCTRDIVGVFTAHHPR